MKIDRILVACCKKDFYLTKICVASIRFWNRKIPIFLLKDLSAGSFDTKELESIFSVGIQQLPFARMNAFSKVFPFVMDTNERVLVMDSDTVWLGNLIPYLEQFSEDLLVHGYTPDNVNTEMNNWYFRNHLSNPLFEKYQYPGFLFNSGQMVLNTGILTLDLVEQYIAWKENTHLKHPDSFLCADQGILNFLCARQIQNQSITLRQIPLYEWGWNYDQKQYPIADVIAKKGHNLLLHWYGPKKGLLFSMPQHRLLYFFERFYFAQIRKGLVQLYLTRLLRTLKHPGVLLYSFGKIIWKNVKD